MTLLNKITAKKSSWLRILSAAALVYACIFDFAGAGEPHSAGTKSRTPAQCGRTAVLIWDAPTCNTNGKPIEDLAGYNIYYGKDPHTYHEVIKVPLECGHLSCGKTDKRKDRKPDRTECTYTIHDLGEGAHYFAVKAYNKTGKESDFSNEVSK